MEIFNVVPGPVPYDDGDYRDQDDDKMEYYCLPPDSSPDPLVMMFTSYLVRISQELR
jgi:hypothetical protein